MSLISELVKFSKLTYDKGFVSATDGNLSIRLKSGEIAITRSGINKGEVTEEDIIIVDEDGKKIDGFGKPSSELKIHMLAYNNRNDINAVVHCHPIYATALGVANFDLTEPVFPEAILSLGPVPLCKYGTPSTEELPDSMLPHISYSWALLLQNHGAVSFGENISSAYYRMEKLEHNAKIIILAKLLGDENKLCRSEVEKLYQISETVYGITPKSPLNKFLISRVDSGSNRHSYIEQIEDRLRERAGNPAVKYKKSDT